MLFPELGLDLVEGVEGEEEEEHSLALSLSSWQVVEVCIFSLRPSLVNWSCIKTSRCVTYIYA